MKVGELKKALAKIEDNDMEVKVFEDGERQPVNQVGEEFGDFVIG